jgi:hypothetical protein
MKKLLRISIVAFGILILVAIVWVALAFYSFMGSRSQVLMPIYSPDGSKVIIPIVNADKDDYNSYLLVSLEIQDMRSKKMLFRTQTRASDRMRWSVNWIDNNTVKLDSSDIGSYCWTEGSDTTWSEIKCP